MPPSTWITWPVTYELRSEARNTATLAMSSTLPPRRKGIYWHHSLRTSSGRAAVMAVSMKPGAMALARMPRLPIS